jgi:RNA polymerase sigma-70 factor (ECF subfamily)
MTVAREGYLSWSSSPATWEDDLATIQRCQEGDEMAFSALYRQYAAYIFRLTYGFLQHREDAEEVLQDTFEYAFRRISHYDPERASFKTWLCQIAISRCRNKRRRKWLLRYYEGLSYPEISEVLGIPAKTAESRMRLAHKKLKEILLDSSDFEE